MLEKHELPAAVEWLQYNCGAHSIGAAPIPQRAAEPGEGGGWGLGVGVGGWGLGVRFFRRDFCVPRADVARAGAAPE